MIVNPAKHVSRFTVNGCQSWQADKAPILGRQPLLKWQSLAPPKNNFCNKSGEISRCDRDQKQNESTTNFADFTDASFGPIRVIREIRG
jgi:hypothetical protein